MEEQIVNSQVTTADEQKTEQNVEQIESKSINENKVKKASTKKKKSTK